MFARTLNDLVNGVALATAAAIALVVGSACTKGPDCLTSSGCGGYTWDKFSVVARGAGVIPAPTNADTAASATGSITGGNSGTLTFTYHVDAFPAGATTVDSIFLYTLAASAPNYTIGGTCATTYVAPSARVCGSSIGTTTTGLAASAPPDCAADVAIVGQPTAVTAANGNVTTNTAGTLTTSMRAYGQQFVIFTTGAFYKRGKIRGTPYLTP